MSNAESWFEHAKMINNEAIQEFNQDLLNVWMESTQRVVELNTKLINNFLHSSREYLNGLNQIKKPEELVAAHAALTQKAQQDLSQSMQHISDVSLENLSAFGQWSEKAMKKTTKAAKAKA